MYGTRASSPANVPGAAGASPPTVFTLWMCETRWKMEAAGRPDSANVHYRWVVNAWRGADPELRVRRDSVHARLTALGVRFR